MQLRENKSFILLSWPFILHCFFTTNTMIQYWGSKYTFRAGLTQISLFGLDKFVSPFSNKYFVNVFIGSICSNKAARTGESFHVSSVNEGTLIKTKFLLTKSDIFNCTKVLTPPTVVAVAHHVQQGVGGEGGHGQGVESELHPGRHQSAQQTIITITVQ